MTNTIYLGFNPGMHSVKATVNTQDGTGKHEATPFPAVIAPLGAIDSFGLGDDTKALTATVGTTYYMGGVAAQRDPLALRQMGNTRLDNSSPLYQAFLQMSWQQLGLVKRVNGTIPDVYIASALPVGWLKTQSGSEDERKAAETAIKKQMETHLRAGLRGLANIKAVYISSEPAAVVYHELIDDDGAIVKGNAVLAKQLVLVADIGGGTINISVLDGLVAVPDQSRSPALGSRIVIEKMMHRADMMFVDAERRLIAALNSPGSDSVADMMLNEYQERVVEALVSAWKPYQNAANAFLFAGGTAQWVKPALQKAFPASKSRYLGQKTIATGLFRYAMMKGKKARA